VARVLEKGVEFPIVERGLLVEQAQVPYARIFCQLHAQDVAGMAPVLLQGLGLGKTVLRVENEQVGFLAEIEEGIVGLAQSGLVFAVCGIDDAAVIGLEAVAEGVARVHLLVDADGNAVDLVAAFRVELHEFDGCGHGLQRNGKKRLRLLRRKYRRQVRVTAVDDNAVTRHVRRGEKGKTLDVVPVQVREKHMPGGGPSGFEP